MPPRFSIVIPAHNVEEYLEQCLDSISRQTFADFETILVADSCTDATVDIAREAGFEPTIVNLGSAGLTRNIGLEKASGEYLLFLDSDDYYLSRDALRIIDLALKDDPVDMLHFGFMMGPRLAHAVDADNRIWVNVWSKAFRRSLYGDLRFTDLRTAEDARWLAEAAARDGSQGHLDVPLVQYRFPRRDSLTDTVGRGTETWETMEGR